MSRDKFEKIIPKRPSLFSSSPSFESTSADKKKIILDLLSETNFESTSSFRYDTPGAGLVSTQQIPVDYSKFENHVFFDSAQSKINVAFDIIVNSFPFDGTKKKVEAFFDGLTGYENYIFSKFPKYTGFLLLSGASGNAPETDGNYIEVYDSAGYLFPNFSSRRDGFAPIDFGKKPLTFEYQLYVPEEVNDCQIIFQKRASKNNGITIALSSSASTSRCDLVFSICSGSSFLLASSSIEKGKFNHIANVFDRNVDNKAKIYVNSQLVSSSSKKEEFESLNFSRASLFIGSGSSFSVDSRMLPSGKLQFIPKQTMSGGIDEVRVFHSARSELMLTENAKKSIYSTDDLRLYFKFNEPTGSYRPNSVVLDASGNSLHSMIYNFSESMRMTGSIENPMKYEKKSLSPILFPDHYLIKNLNTSLLRSGSRYDNVNPNLITKLVPPHLFLDGQSKQGLDKLQGSLYGAVNGTSIPGSLKLGTAQRLTAFLFIYAKMFDELKIVIDSISDFLNISYDDHDSVPDQLIPMVAKHYGINIPSLFSNSTIFEFIDGEDICDTYGFNGSLKNLQNQLWKRFLINLPYVIKSKGTISSIKSTIRSFGINPDNLMNIREFGGPTKKSIENLRQNRVKNLPLIDFSGSIGVPSATEDAQGFFSNIPNIVSPFLSGSRVSPGYPEIQGDFVDKTTSLRNGISNNREDGLFTSGSFTYEAYYRFINKTRKGPRHPHTQSLARICVTGSNIDKGAVTTNLVAFSGSDTSSLSLYVRSSQSSVSNGIKLELTGTSIFNGDPWYISFGRTRSDDIVTSVSESYLSPKMSMAGSSSYFLRCSRVANGKLVESFETGGLFKDEAINSTFQNMSTTYNDSGSFIVIGSQSLGSYGTRFLNDSALGSVSGFDASDSIAAKTTEFSGHVGKIRFWSGNVTRKESSDHALNPSSIGSRNPTINYSFVAHNSGSFQRPRMDIQLEQPVTSSSPAGSISLTNFTQVGGNFEGKGFEYNKNIVKNETIFYSVLSPKFDLAQSDEKIRVRSYNEADSIKNSSYASSAPVYEVRKSESPDDDNRFSIEFSSVKALEDDIMSIFSDLIFFDNALGKPDLMFDEIYPDLEQARKVYFRRLFAKPEFQNYFSMFKWFNNSLGYIIEQLIPRNTKFLGVDFVYESHPLERNRFRYLFDEIYLLSNERSFDRGDILLSQYVGQLKKF